MGTIWRPDGVKARRLEACNGAWIVIWHFEEGEEKLGWEGQSAYSWNTAGLRAVNPDCNNRKSNVCCSRQMDGRLRRQHTDKGDGGEGLVDARDWVC